MTNKNNTYEVAIIGAGVCGTALLYTLSKYTNINKIALIEKESGVALINSYKNNNSQTLHFGDIETNYTLEKAKKVNGGASLVKNYLLIKDSQKNIYTKYHKMVLAIGTEEANELRNRYQEFKQLFPDLRLLNKQEIASIEPKVLEGRETETEILALFTDQGFTVDFHKLAESFLANATENQVKNIDLMMDTKVKKITKKK